MGIDDVGSAVIGHDVGIPAGSCGWVIDRTTLIPQKSALHVLVDHQFNFIYGIIQNIDFYIRYFHHYRKPLFDAFLSRYDYLFFFLLCIHSLQKPVLGSSLMRHFRIEEESNDSQNQSKITFRQALAKTLSNTIKLLPFAEFTVNYGYAIENVWVTMVMIVHKTPAWLDSFVWITPIILAVLFRPYIVRFIHQINLKVYREINVTSIALVIGAIGCFITGLSCDVQKKKNANLLSQTFVRILVCTIGWTLTDLGFEFALFFAEKIKESHEELLQKDEDKEKQEKQENHGLFTQQNFAFYGLLVGYVVSILICWIIHGKSIKAFYRCAKYAYYSAGILAAITGLRLYIEGKLNLPHRSDQPINEKLSNNAVITFERKIDFYLPGYTELMSSNTYTFSLLVVHGIIVFLNDIILIYTTMWFSDIKGMKYGTQGQAYIYGLQVGSLTLLAYTVIDNLKIRSILFSNPYILQAVFIAVGIIFAFANIQYGHIGFISLAISVSILNQFYRRAVLARQSQQNPPFERCIETTQRIEKIIVLSVFPAIVLLILNRDDIPDSLIVSSVLSILALLAFLLSKISLKANNNQIQGVKVEKVQ